MAKLIFDKAGKNIQWNKDSLFSKWCWENWTATCRRMNLDHFLRPDTKINSKWIKYLNVRPETIKILGESTSSSFFDISYSNTFLDRFPEARGGKKAKLNGWDYIRMKSFCTAKETINNKKDNLLKEKRYLQIICSIRG